MYEKFFGLKENPFSIAPDPRYLYMSEQHRDALAHLLFGIEREGGVVVLTGEVGTGKTTLCRYFLQRLPEKVQVAFILHPKLTARELLAAICDEFGIAVPIPANTKVLVDAIHGFLLEQHARGKHLALLIDEAQNLAPDVLEQLRLLTNLETDRKKLLQIILLGQPELREILGRDNLRQLAQRVTARYHLKALGAVDVRAYVAYRLSVAGGRSDLFTPRAIRRLHRLSRGIPRLINLIADRALLGAYAEHADQITPEIVSRAAREVGFLTFQREARWRLDPMTVKAIVAGSVTGMVTLLVAGMLMKTPAPAPDHAVSASLAEPPPTESPSDVGAGPGEMSSAPPGTATSEASPMGTAPAAGVADSAPVATTAPAKDLDASTDGPDAAAVLEAPPENPASPLERYRPGASNTQEAWLSVLRSWGVQGGPSRSQLACDYAEIQGLRCLHRRGNWRSLVLLDRPAVLKLLNGEGLSFQVALLGLDKRGFALIELDGQSLRLPLQEIDRRWQGDYSLLYRLPPYQSSVIRPGAIQDEKAWLDQRLSDVAIRWLSTAGGASSDDLPPANADLTQRIRWFQGIAGIEQDGVAGAVTLISLDNWLDPSVPRLSRRATGGN